MATKRSNIRLTDKAHRLLTEKAENSGFSMKEIASEAVMLMFRQKRDNKRFAFGTFVLGALTGGCLVFACFWGMI